MADRRILHIIAGDDTWTPTTEELRELCNVFMESYVDPNGSVVVTRKGVRMPGAVRAEILWIEDNANVTTDVNTNDKPVLGVSVSREYREDDK